MKGHWPFFKFMILLSFGRSSADHCDRVSTAQMQEGNLGQSGDFNWLGVLHVDLNEFKAISGIVLIKVQYVLVNADDVARIPHHIFKSSSRAMFLPTRDTPLFVKTAAYVTHPEYEDSVLNSIAVIELDLEDVEDFPLTPICLSTAKTFSASRYLYLTGFTHENQVLEKVIYKIQYLDKKICEKFYNREELSPQKLMPSAYMCGYSPNSATQCVWDNGMTLVSNTFGYLNLIGFGIHGPGCAVPTRFIDLFPYFQWINSITVKTDYGTKKFIPKSRSKHSDIPIHDLYTMKGSGRRQQVIPHGFDAYPHHLIEAQFHHILHTKDENIFYIYPYEPWEKFTNACGIPQEIIYREFFEVKTLPKFMGTATYRLSLFDLFYTECICVRLTVESTNSSQAVLKFREEINFKYDVLNERLVIHPEEIFRVFLVNHNKPENLTDDLDTVLKVPFEPYSINDHDVLNNTVKTYDLFITLEFYERATLEFLLLAKLPKDDDNTSSESTTSSPTTSESTTPSPTTENPRRRAKIRHRRLKKKSKTRWGVDTRAANNWAANMLRKAEVSVREER